jgi:hypothetical protein
MLITTDKLIAQDNRTVILMPDNGIPGLIGVYQRNSTNGRA